MSGLGAFGAFAKGAVSGYKEGLELQDKINKRKDDKQKKADEEEIKKAGLGLENQYYEDTPIQVKGSQPISSQPMSGASQPQPVGTMDYGLGNMDYVNKQGAPESAIGLKNGGLVKKYADGGLVSMAADPEGLSYKANMAAGLSDVAAPQESAPEQTQSEQPKRRINHGKTMSNRFNAMRDKAIELGRMDLAKDYHDLGFQVRDRMVKDGLTTAQRQFQMTGDIKGFISIYNDAIDDGATIDGYERTENGYKLNINDNGNLSTREVGREELESMVMEFSAPENRYAAERKLMAEKEKAKLETDEKIRLEKSKGVTLSAGQKHFSADGKELYNPKDDSSLSETELAFKASQGDQNAIKALDLIQGHKATIAREGRAPRAEREPSFERLAYEDWAAEPQNKGKGKNQYLKEKATWSQSEPLDSVTQTSEKYNDDGSVTKESRTSKVKPQKPQSPQYQEYLNARDKAKGNPAVQAKIDAIARANKVIK